MSRRPKTTVPPVEKPETVASVLGIDDSAKQVEVVKSLLSEVIQRRRMRQIFVSVVATPASEEVKILFSQDATYDEVLAVLETAKQALIEERYKKAEAAKQKSETPPGP